MKDLNKIEKEILDNFWHQEDDVKITSLGHLWTYPGKKLTNNSM